MIAKYRVPSRWKLTGAQKKEIAERLAKPEYSFIESDQLPFLNDRLSCYNQLELHPQHFVAKIFKVRYTGRNIYIWVRFLDTDMGKLHAKLKDKIAPFIVCIGEYVTDDLHVANMDFRKLFFASKTRIKKPCERNFTNGGNAASEDTNGQAK